MTTATVIPAYKQALLDAWATASPQVPGNRRWPGPSTKSEQMFLGESRSEQDIASIKQGRQHRQETAELEVIFQTYRANPSASDTERLDVWLFDQYAALDDLLADDPTLDGATGLAGWSAVVGHETVAEPFETGWSARLTATVRIHARLT